MLLISQIKKNLLAVISIIIAVSTLSYTTYRNELTEENRNMRHAGFELLKELNELQLLIDYAHYDNDPKNGNPIQGWSHVAYISDMSHLVSDDVVKGAIELKQAWSNNWSIVQNDVASNKVMTDEINNMRMVTRKAIVRLR